MLLLVIILCVVGIRAYDQCAKGQNMDTLIQSIETCANAITSSQLSTTIQDERCPSDVSATLEDMVNSTATSLLKIMEGIANNHNTLNHIAETVRTTHNLLKDSK